jgi:hypothetical protein
MRWSRVRFTVRRMIGSVALGLTLGMVELWASGERIRRPRPATRFSPHPEDHATSTLANLEETVFLGTVTRIDNMGHSPSPFLQWVVALKIDEVILRLSVLVVSSSVLAVRGNPC